LKHTSVTRRLIRMSQRSLRT